MDEMTPEAIEEHLKSKLPLSYWSQKGVPVDLCFHIVVKNELPVDVRNTHFEYWQEQFSGDKVTDEEIAISSDILVYPDEKYKVDLTRFNVVDGASDTSGFVDPTDYGSHIVTSIPSVQPIEPEKRGGEMFNSYDDQIEFEQWAFGHSPVHYGYPALLTWNSRHGDLYYLQGDQGIKESVQFMVLLWHKHRSE